MRTVPLGDLIRPAGTRAKSGNELPVYSVTKHSGFVPSLEYFKKQIFSREVAGYKIVEAGDFAYATIHLDEGSIGVAPEPALISPMYTVFRADDARVDTAYLLRFLKSPRALAHYPQLGNGAVHRRKAISLQALSGLPVPLPSLREQQQIAMILDTADILRTKRRRCLDLLDDLARSLFDAEFADSAGATVRPLGQLAEVVSGLTKGRKLGDQATHTVPYLAVANVQSGHLRLDAVKEIEATETEIERYRLRVGDLVMTEGGDPDKLGRGTLWQDELPLCLHQNHIFRVRVQSDSGVEPQYLAAFIAAPAARSYFLRSAKQTTGIASINMTQLRGLPVVVPSLQSQRRFIGHLERAAALRVSLQHGAHQAAALFASLQSRAFSGDLKLSAS